MKKFFKIQRDFQKKLYDLEKLTHEEKVKLSKDFILAAHKELSEVLDCLEWKNHRKEDKNFVFSNLNEEIIDVFKYIVNICVVWGISSNQFEDVFDSKTMVVLQRYKQEFLKPNDDEKTCAIDLDDVLNEWERFFVDTFNEKYKTKFTSDKQIRNHLGPLKYAEYKHWWRDSGIKRKIPAKCGASSFVKSLKKKGYRIVIISSRPYREYSRIFSDTLWWLKKNHIKFDDIYFEEHKHLKILKHFPKLSFMVEDNKDYAFQVAKEGYRVYLLSKEKVETERQPFRNTNVMIVNSLHEILKHV